MKRAKPKTFSDELRRLVVESGITRYKLAQDTGIDQGRLSRFVHGKTWLSEEAIDRLAEHLGLTLKLTEVTASTKKRPAKKRKRKME